MPSFGQFFLFKSISNLNFDTSNSVDKFSRCVFKLNSSNSYIENSGLALFFKFPKLLVQKLGLIPCTHYPLSRLEIIWGQSFTTN